MYNVILSSNHVTIVAVEQPFLLYFIYSKCASLAFIIQHAKRLRLFILWSPQFYDMFPRYLIKDKIFEKNCIELEMFISISSTNSFSETFVIIRII